MFRDEITNKVSKSGEKSHKLIIKTRPKIYFEKDKKTGETVKVGEGFEIVKELTVSADTYNKRIGGTNV